MSPSRKVAVVTGSNKGIGLAIVKGLLEKFDGDVFLTARNSAKGKSAVEKLKALGFNPQFHQLDVADQNSVDTFRDFIKNTYGGLDILVNNAGVYADKSLPIGDQAEQNVGVNYFGTLRVSEALSPLLRANARVVNVSSSAGRLKRIPSADLQAQLTDPNLTIEKLSNLMKQYIQATKQNNHMAEGWGDNAYVVSKVGLSALTLIQQRLFDQETPKRNICANFVHPGAVITDMNRNGVLHVDDGAKSALFAVFQPNFKGKYVWYDCRIIDWDGPLPQ